MSNSEQFWENAKQTTSCYLTYDEAKKTYILSDWDWKKLEQRALIWEWVKITPPSKIMLEAKATLKERQKAQIEEMEKKELTESDMEDLFSLMPEKMRDKLRATDYREFFRITEQSMNERIKEAKAEWYDLAADPVINPWDEWEWYILELNLINWSAETRKPLIRDEFSKDVRKAFREKDLKKYITARIQTKWRDWDHLTKKWSVIESKDGDNWEYIDINQKSFALKWLSLLWNWAEAVSNKIWDTWLKNDDREFAGIINLIRDAENDINTNNITSADIQTIKSKLTEKIAKFFKNNVRSRLQINSWEVAWYIDDIISSWDKEKQIVALRKMWASRTWFDNSQTAFLRDEIFDEYGRKQKVDENWEPMVDEEWNPVYEEWVIDLKDDSYEVYFENINKLYQIDPSEIWEDWELPREKKEAIDELYEKARTYTGKHWVKNFKAYLISKWLLPDERSHGGQLDEKVKMLKMQLEKQEKYANKFEITGSEVKERTRQKLSELQLTLSSSQIQAAENWDDWKNDEGIARLNALNFMLQQDDSFFESIATDETESIRKTMRYWQVDDMVRWNLAPFLVRKWWWINASWKMAEIYNDSVWAWGWFDFSDEWAEKVWPAIIDIAIEVVVTVVSILLSWNGAWEAIYWAYQAGLQAAKAAIEAASAASKIARFLKKLRAFIKAFMSTLLKNIAAQTCSHLWIKTSIRWVNIATKETVRGLKWWSRLAIRWTSTIIEWSTFYINNTMIHNLINWEDILKWVNPAGYEEWPDWEHIPNRQGYARTIAFIWVLKWLDYIRWLEKVQAFTTKWNTKVSEGLKNLWTDKISNALKSKIPVNKATNIMKDLFKDFNRVPVDMWGVMLADQAVSLAFDWRFKEISWEDLVVLFWMVAWLRIGKNIKNIIVKEIKNSPSWKKSAVLETTDQAGNKKTITVEENWESAWSKKWNSIEWDKVETQNLQELQKNYNELEAKIQYLEWQMEMEAEAEIWDNKILEEIQNYKTEQANLRTQIEQANRQIELDALNISQNIDNSARD